MGDTAASRIDEPGAHPRRVLRRPRPVVDRICDGGARRTAGHRTAGRRQRGAPRDVASLAAAPARHTAPGRRRRCGRARPRCRRHAAVDRRRVARLVGLRLARDRPLLRGAADRSRPLRVGAGPTGGSTARDRGHRRRRRDRGPGGLRAVAVPRLVVGARRDRARVDRDRALLGALSPTAQRSPDLDGGCGSRRDPADRGLRAGARRARPRDVGGARHRRRHGAVDLEQRHAGRGRRARARRVLGRRAADGVAAARRRAPRRRRVLGGARRLVHLRRGRRRLLLADEHHGRRRGRPVPPSADRVADAAQPAAALHGRGRDGRARPGAVPRLLGSEGR